MTTLVNPFMSYPAAGGSSFNPLTDITWNRAFWASDPDWTAPAGGGAVSSWRDGSGNGLNATQASGAKQPLFRSSYAGLNSKPAVEFDGSDDGLVTASSALAQPVTYVAVGKYIALPADGYIMAGVDGGPQVRDSGGKKWGYYAGGSPVVGSLADTASHLFVFVADGSSSVFRVDGLVVASGSGGTQGVSTLTLGSYTGAVAAYSNLALAFAGVYAGTLPTGDQDAIQAWSQTFYGTP